MTFIRKPHSAGKHEEVEDIESKEWLDSSTFYDRITYGITMHLLNHGVDPETYRFERKFHSAFKRKHEPDVLFDEEGNVIWMRGKNLEKDE